MQQLPQWQPMPSIYALFIQHGLDVLTLEAESGVHYLAIWDVLVGNLQTEQVIAQLLAAINRIKGTHYQL